MASKRCRNDSLLPWILAIEALASNKTDTSLLIDLVKKIPGDFSENDGKNARELVCLRILESLAVLEKGKVSDVLPKPDSSARISPSDCCEDVLRQILRKSSIANQESTESEMSNRDVEQFVENKRSCLPKCGLEQLKDVILKDNDLIPLSVKEKSGLLNKNHSDGNATRPKRSDSDAFENRPVRDLSSGKTDVSDSANANQEGSSACNQLFVYKEYTHNNAALKRKQDAFCAQKAVEGKDSAFLNERMHVVDVPGGIVQHSGREESDLLREPRVENLRDTVTSENVDSDRVASKKLKMSSTVADAELLHNQLQGPCNVEIMTQGTSGEEHGLNISADEAKKDERMHVVDVPGGIVQHSGREESDLLREPRVENLRDTVTSENVDSDRVASKKLKMSSTVADAELLHNQLQGPCNVEIMTQGTSGEEHGLNISADEAKKDGEGYVELRTIGSSPHVVNQGTKSADGAKENCEHSLSLTPSSVRCGEVKTTMEHDHQLETLSDDENDEILIRNNTFLNSQYSHSQDSLATLNGSKQLCMVCKIGGQVLVCSSGSCQRVVHERCMGFAPTFDATWSFYCPFCAYSQAISEYSESKKKYSLARKALVAFINRDEYRMRNSSNISCRADQNNFRESAISDKCVEQNRLENVVSREIQNSSRNVMRDKPSVSCDSSNKERAGAVTCGGNEVALEDKRNAERCSSSVCCQSPCELKQQVPVLSVQNGEADSSLHGGSEQLAAVEKLQEVSHQPKGVAPVENKEDQYVAFQAVQDSEVHKSKSKDLKIAHGRKRKQQAGSEKEQDVSNQQPVLPCEPAKPTHSDVAKSSGEKNKSITYPSLRVRKREQQYTYPSIPQLKRKKIPWSNAEEEALKEGVKRFGSNHDRQMPWKTILEFGADIFENRTTIDLKDKWRNICKASPKV